MSGLTLSSAAALPALVRAAGPKASTTFLEFFVSHIRNPNTRRAYGRAVGDFMTWCGEAGVPSIADVQPLQWQRGLKS